ncbi:5812_t:CDS:2, partial [Paraglomus occultum]
MDAPTFYVRLTSDEDAFKHIQLYHFDAKIIVGVNENAVSFLTHSVKLRQRSEFFNTALSNTWIRRENGVAVIHKPNMSPELFEEILKFIYFENIPINVLEAHARDLFFYSDELLIDTLLGSIFSAWLNSIKESLKLPHFFITAVNTIYNYSTLKSCQDDFAAMFEQDPWNFYNHPNLSDLHEDIMKILAKKACQYGNGEVFLDVLIKWGIERNARLVKEPFYQWKSKHFDLLADTISGALQEVKFGQRPERYAHFNHLSFDQIFHGDFEQLNWYKGCDISKSELPANPEGGLTESTEIHAQLDSLPIPFTDTIQKILVAQKTENTNSSFTRPTKNWPRVKTSYNFVLSYHKMINSSLPSFHEFFQSYLHSAPALVVLRQGPKTVAGLSM